MLIVAFRNFANAPKNEAQDECTCMSVGTHCVLCHYQCSSTNGPLLNLCPSANFTYRYVLFSPTTAKTTTTTTTTISTVATATVTRGKLQVEISRFRAEWPGFESRYVQRIFLSSKTSRPALGPTWTPTQGVLLIFKTVGVWGLPLTLHLAPRLRMNGATPTLPHTHLWREQGQLYLYLLWDICVASRVERRTTRFGIRSCIAQK